MVMAPENLEAKEQAMRREIIRWTPDGDLYIVEYAAMYVKNGEDAVVGKLTGRGMPNSEMANFLVEFVNSKKLCYPHCTSRTVVARLEALYTRFQAVSECEAHVYLPRGIAERLGAEYDAYLQECKKTAAKFGYGDNQRMKVGLFAIHGLIGWRPLLDNIILDFNSVHEETLFAAAQKSNSHDFVDAVLD